MSINNGDDCIQMMNCSYIPIGHYFENSILCFLKWVLPDWCWGGPGKLHHENIKLNNQTSPCYMPASSPLPGLLPRHVNTFMCFFESLVYA